MIASQEPGTETVEGILSPEERAKQLHRLAIGLFREGRSNEARQAIQMALAEAETSVRWNDFATIALSRNDLAGAEHGYRCAVEIDPCNARATTNLVVFLESQGRWVEAQDFRRLVPEELVAASWREVTKVSRVEEECNRLLDAIKRLRTIDSADAGPIADAQRRGMHHCGYFVRQALELLAPLEPEIMDEMLKRIDKRAEEDYRFGVIGASLRIKQNDYDGALIAIRAANLKNPDDLFLQERLMECMSALSGGQDQYSDLARYLPTRICTKVFTDVEIREDGNVFLCCPGWLPLSAGNVRNGTVDEIFNSPTAQAIRASMLDGSFRYCSKTQCSLIMSKELPERSSFSPESLQALQEGRRPGKVRLAYDKSCNLTCPQCRSGFIIANKAEQQQMEDKFTPWVLEALTDADLVHLNGAGEVFASKHSRALLKRMSRSEFPKLRFEIISNANVFDERVYDEMDLAGRLEAVRVSIDAATAETYKITRRNGDFERLMRNLAFLDGLRTSGRDRFRLDLFFVVSKPNFREMPDFVRLAKRFNADMVLFTMLKWTDGLTREELKEWSVFYPDHPLYPEFLEVLQSPELADPIVSSNFADLTGGTSLVDNPLWREADRSQLVQIDLP